ncbi:prepilin peptidase [Plantactinospora sonchi]|uniref:Prepilin peptidase n=1 Tax=Plantactinospora sonchi TaxID=1544735 RepID=A0ABU7RPH1_9ACTN
MNPGVAATLAGLVGVLLGPSLRGQILRYAVPAGEPTRRRCPHCAATLFRPGVPRLLGAVSPTARCPHCRQRTGPHPGTVEVLTGVLLAALAWRITEPLPLLAYGWLALCGVVLGAVDVAVRRLPDRLTRCATGGTVLLFTVAVLAGEPAGRLGVALACGLGVALLYLVLVLASPTGLGAGDVRLGLLLGTAAGWYGWPTALNALLAGLLLASGTAAVLLGLRRVNRQDQLPHGPAMLVGTFGAVLLAA